MRVLLIPAFTVALGAGFFASSEAQARFNAAQVQAPSLMEDIACVTRRVRTVRPNGSVVYRTVRDCGVRAYPRCRWVRERVYRPNGRVVVRDVRRCY